MSCNLVFIFTYLLTLPTANLECNVEEFRSKASILYMLIRNEGIS